MEVIPAAVFIPAVIAGVTQFIKGLSEKIKGPVTVVVALVVGVVLALIDKQIGVQDISVAQGIVGAFGTVGIIGSLKMVGGGDTTRLSDMVETKK